MSNKLIAAHRRFRFPLAAIPVLPGLTATAAPPRADKVDFTSKCWRGSSVAGPMFDAGCGESPALLAARLLPIFIL